MILKKIIIKRYKNLNDFELTFKGSENRTALLIGNNGSGKSNVIEAVSSLFASLYTMQTKGYDFQFLFEINYELNGRDILISKLEPSSSLKFSIDAEVVTQASFQSNKEEYLPDQVIAIYSGEEQRLWNDFYRQFYLEFMSEVKSDFQGLPSPKLIYLNRFFWNISLLSLLYSELDNNASFCKSILSLDSLEGITVTFEFNDKNIKNFQDNSIVSFVKSLANGTNGSRTMTIEQLRENSFIASEKELFIKLMAAVMDKEESNKLITGITISFSNSLTTESLSEGEKKHILLRTALENLSTENTLLLFDEPDSSLHIAKKYLIKELFDEYTNRFSILTTHSPTLTHSFGTDSIYMLRDGSVEDRSKQEMFSYITDSIWNYQEQSIFLSSKKSMLLVVEGKHDKIHISEAFLRLKSEYPNLDFDIFSTDGATNLKQFVIGFSNSDFDFEGKKIIAIFDNDDEGRKSFNNCFKKTLNSKRDVLGMESNLDFYGVMLPKRENFDGECTIENMFFPEKFQEATKIAMLRRIDDASFFDKGVNEISKQLKDDAKDSLASSVKNFEDSDFEHFKSLFNLLNEIENGDITRS